MRGETRGAHSFRESGEEWDLGTIRESRYSDYQIDIAASQPYTMYEPTLMGGRAESAMIRMGRSLRLARVERSSE